MNRRETLMLAHNYHDKIDVKDWFVSEKLDGMRAWWDGGITRNVPCKDVPWANIEKSGASRVCTGLWSRYFKPIYAPNWWLDALPQFPLDGELYLGKKRFQEGQSIIKRLVPDESDWKQIHYHVFDIPPLRKILLEGKINLPSFRKEIDGSHFKWAVSRITGSKPPCERFEDVVLWFQTNWQSLKVIVLPQIRLNNHVELMDLLDKVTDDDGEGLILRHRNSYWFPRRSHDLLKLKKLHDDEGVVIGYTWGEKTDRGSKLLGMMGSLRVKWKGKEFDLSGFSDQERRMHCEGYDASLIGSEHPGERTGSGIVNPLFPIGSVVTFRYRETTVDGLPKEARYYR